MTSANPSQWRQSADRLYREILNQITRGENNGFDDVWLSERHFIEDGYLPSILPVAAAIAARTDRIRIVSGVLLVPFHNPVRLAEDIATVDVISGGRFELGAGAGCKREEFEGFGVALKERGARTNQSLEIICRALAGIGRPHENVRRSRRPHHLSGRQPFGMALRGWASAPFGASARSRATAGKRPFQGRRPRRRDQHDSELHQQRPDHPFLFVDIATGIAAEGAQMHLELFASKVIPAFR
jgi:alkanesulfonate monooxygenase SsuD/methylene tetrahydromethanopterin reductase-like flavin-dependent oxidoreductase (luciferase family)